MNLPLNNTSTAEFEPWPATDPEVLRWYDATVRDLTDRYIKCRNEHGEAK